MDDRPALRDSAGDTTAQAQPPVGKTASEENGSEGDLGSRVSALITFFGPRASGYAVHLKCREHYFALCTRSPLRLDDEERDESSVDERRKQIRDALQKKDGGIIAEISANRSRLTVTAVNAKGYKAPQKMLRLSANETVAFVGIDSPISYEAGDSYLIPVDKSAQEKLAQLKDALEFLPQDQERSIFNLIREPRLELRLQVLEWAVSAGSASGRQKTPATVAQSSGTQTPLRQLFGLPLGLGWVVLCALVLGGLLWYRTSPASSRGQPGGAKSQTASADGSAPRASDVQEIDKAAQALLLAMKESPRPPVTHLYNSHYLSDAEAQPLKSKDFAEALLKLEFLRLQALKDNSHDIDGTNSREDMSKILDAKKRLGAGGLEGNALAYLGCQYKTGDQPKIAGIEIPGSCDSPNDAQKQRIRMGFEELTKWVSTKPERTAAPAPRPRQ